MNWKTLAQIAVIFGAVLIADSASATTWHVRSTAACANNGNGTASTCAASAGGAGAWRGLASIGWASVQPGDSVLLFGGDTYTDRITVGKSGTGSGITFTNPITISVENTSNGTNPAIIDLANATATAFNNSGRAYIVYDFLYGQAAIGDPSGIADTNYGLKVINVGSNGNCVADFSNGGPIKVLHMDCSGDSTSGGDAAGGVMGNGGNVDGWEIAYNWLHGTYTGATTSLRWHASGVMLFSSSATNSFTNNLIHHNKVEYLYHDGIKSGNHTSIYNNEAAHIEGSGHADSLQCQGGSWCQIYNNWVHNSGDQAIYIDKVGGTNVTASHIRIYNNLVTNSSFCMVLHPEYADYDDMVIANNTCAGPFDNSAIRKGGACTGTCPHYISNLALLNNIIGTSQQSAKQIDFNSGTVTFADANAFNYNVYMSPSSAGSFIVNALACGQCTLAGLRALSPPRETNGQVASPTFVSGSNWHLASGDTVAKGRGRNLYSTYTFLQTDRDGIPRPSTGAWDVGAYAVSSSTGNPPPSPPTGLAAVVN